MTERFPFGPASTARNHPPPVSFWAHRYLWLSNDIKRDTKSLADLYPPFPS